MGIQNSINKILETFSLLFFLIIIIIIFLCGLHNSLCKFEDSFLR